MCKAIPLCCHWGFDGALVLQFAIAFFMHVNSKRVNWQYDEHCTRTIWFYLDGDFRIIKFTSECVKLFMAHAYKVMRNLFVLLFMQMKMVAQNILLTSVLAAPGAWFVL